MIEHIKRTFAGVKTCTTDIGFRFFVLFADFVLKASAFQIFVKAFIAFYCFAHFIKSFH